jgi:hypothetical protein
MSTTKRRATIVRWGARQFGFARESEADGGLEWFIHGYSIIGGRRDLAIGTLIEFEPHPQSKNDGRAPVATLVQVIEAEVRR